MSDAGPLLVPIELAAMALVGHSGREIRRPQMSYDNVQDFTTPEPQPFVGKITQTPDELGVYLMWTLPAALRRGTQTVLGSGAVDFPFAPNRWLVVRTLTQAGAQPAATAWIVESDSLDDGTSPYIAADGTSTNVGAKTELAGWAERKAQQAPFLRAVAGGNPAFAAFQPHNENVFSIKDDLSGIDAGTLDYFVAGWYAGDGDPLSHWTPQQDNGYAAALDSLRWSAPDPEHRTTTRSVYHGMLLNLEWSRDGGPLKSAADDVKPQLALGNTSIDALVAFLKAGKLPDSDAELLEAFTLDLLAELQQPGGEAILERRLHASWFASEAGGYVWDIVDAPTAPGTRPEPPDDEQRSTEQALLATLNSDQAKLDGERRRLASLQRELYELWWKRGYGEAIDRPAGISDSDLAQAQQQLAGTIRQLSADVAGRAGLPDPNAAHAKAPGLPDSRVLAASLAPRFYAPSDPVLLVAGLGHDLVIDPEAKLACRYADGLVTAIGAGGHVTRAGDVTPPAVPATLPAAIAPLLTEFELLRSFCAADRPGFAKRIAGAAQAADDAAFATAASTSDAVLGTRPGLALAPWEQAWLPLYLEWKADWQELPYADPPKWTFDGHDFSVKGARAFEADSSPSGRTLLTPGLAFAVRSRLEQYIAGDPSDKDLQTLEDDVGTINDWDFLSQTLDGLTTQLAWRDSTAAPGPDATIAGDVGENYGQAPYFHPGATFQGMRAGRLALTRVAIVDRFGQTLELLGEGTKLPIVPSVAAGLKPTDPTFDGVAQLPPRLLQGSRLRISVAHAAGALCGFVMPDHIDRALAAYDASGARLGELRLVATGTGSELVWDPAPLDSTLDDLESDMAAVLHAVQAAGAGAFENFLTTIDETLWTIDPLAGDQDDELTVLAGRALAVVEATLAFELGGEPLRDPNWQNTLTPADPPFLGYDFPVQLGAAADREDGLVGYFCDSAYARFHAVRVPLETDLVDDPAQFVTAAAPDDVKLRFDGSTVAQVTLLVDPRGEVQAHTGLLPTTTLSLPRTRLAPALAAISVAFRAGPLLAAQPPADGAGVPLMPTPTASGRTWSWIEENGSPPAAFPTVDDRARLSTLTPTAREGFVRVDRPGGRQ